MAFPLPRAPRAFTFGLLALVAGLAVSLLTSRFTLLASAPVFAQPGSRGIDAIAVDYDQGGWMQPTFDRPTVALTFDDGPDPRWTRPILETLDRHDATATFFVVGSRVRFHRDITNEILDGGHELGDHTWSHPYMAKLSPLDRRVQHRLTRAAIVEATGLEPSLYRPPYSSFATELADDEYAEVVEAANAGYAVVLSDLMPPDWMPTTTVDEIVELGMPEPGTSAIVTLHDGGKDRANTVAAVEILVQRLAAQGYDFVTVSEYLGIPEDEAMREAGAVEKLKSEGIGMVVDQAGVDGALFPICFLGLLVLGFGRRCARSWG